MDTLKWYFWCFLTFGEENKEQRRESERTKEARDEDVAKVVLHQMGKGWEIHPCAHFLPSAMPAGHGDTEEKRGFQAVGRWGTPR